MIECLEIDYAQWFIMIINITDDLMILIIVSINVDDDWVVINAW
jgi:hypothetical protein